jgi:NADH-quinone oxidoreductase subunit J
MSLELIAMVVLSLLALVSAVVVVFHRNPVVCALALAFNLVSIAGFYLLLNAQFLALLQVIVYAGAIMVLILFVIMLLNLPEEARRPHGGFFQKSLGLIFSVALVGVLATALLRSSEGARYLEPSPEFGSVSALGTTLFTKLFYPFEAVSLLLIVAMIGAVLLAKRRL